MDKTQTNHLRMHHGVQHFLDENTRTWSSIPRLVQYKNTFDSHLVQVDELSEDAQSGVGVTEKKNQLKNVIGIKLAVLSGVLVAYAYDSNKLDLLKKVKFTKSDIDRLKETDIDAFAKAITKQATELLTELVDFAITAEHIEEINTTVDDFNVLIGKPRTILNKKYTAISTIEETLGKIDDLLNQKIDNMMLIFKDSNSSFYEEYKRARVIVDM